ncbi:GNAT family N-acetyltransferase [Luteipulveratus sp. YIM 133132]|uniref:GNAT family N-acetyltransferase n=1 Tax=Luteipulveratus flavus TaxID=3031728 RepID=UPI0023B14233|nr:GNAT family N-acetyltransferase [Luteipulveratus sp. YIM 133132]MDE9365903.1 GNAT family N-acetyltransferase [Luteipulveratus sp. YIM 133132]
MTIPQPGAPAVQVPSGWGVRVPTPDDLAALVSLLAAHQQAVRGRSSVDADAVRSEVVGPGSWTRRHLLAVESHGDVAAWARVHDRAAGRTTIDVTVRPDVDDAQADPVAASLFEWCCETAREIGRVREQATTQLDATAIAGDERQARWMTAAGLVLTRTWLQMSRPVTAEEASPDAFPAPRAGVVVRRVAQHEGGLPVAEDLRAVHLVLEESFADHFNSYRESFAEFVTRLREDPGHRWDHWWLATVELPSGPLLAGAVVGSVLPEDADGFEGSYIDYIGVHREARGRGVAKALLHTVIRDAAERGRNRVGLEVDADSPTGADGLYASMGWETSYRTESWQRDVATT